MCIMYGDISEFFCFQFVRKQIEDVQLSSSVLCGSIDGLIVACRQDPINITLKLLQYLKPGHPFAVFSPYKEVIIKLNIFSKVMRVPLMD